MEHHMLNLLQNAAEVNFDRSDLANSRVALRQMVLSGGKEPWAEVVTITPPMAAAMMERNKDEEWENRPQSQRAIKRYVTAMARGAWKLTGETIIFSKGGKLLNGQHRLIACIQAGVGFQTFVVFGIDEDSFMYMDIGTKRTAGHIFAINGVPNYNWAAAVTRVVKAYRENEKWSGWVDTASAENDELFEYYEEHSEGIQQAFSISHAFTREGILAPRWAGALLYICALKNKEDAYSFFGRVASGLDLNSKTDPVFLIRKRLLENARRTRGERDSELYSSAYLMQAWNAFRAGNKRSIFRWRGGQNPDEIFPRAM